MGTLLKNKIFAEVNNDKNIVNELIKNYGKITFQGDKRTLWYNGMPYGTAYYKITDGQLSNSSQNHGCDVFGTVRDHQMTKDNINYAVIMGSNNQASVDNSLALGKYNKSTENIDGNTKNYIFSIGNGTSTDIKNRSNLLQVDTEGKLTTSYISYTMLDTSYVSSLGQDATMNVVMEALLTAPNYYAPQSGDFIISFDNIPSNNSILLSTQTNEITLKVQWKKNKPKWDEAYIKTYINKHKKLPEDVELKHLCYCSYLGDTKYNMKLIESKGTFYCGNNSSGFYTKKPLLNPIELHPDSANLTPIYGGTNNYDFILSANTITPLTFTSIGRYNLVQNLSFTIPYGPSQDCYFEQLAQKGVFVVGGIKKDGGTVTTNTANLTIHVGLNIYTGVTVTTDNIDGKTNILDLQKIITDDKYDATRWTNEYLFTDVKNDLNISKNIITSNIAIIKSDFKNNTLNNNIYDYLSSTNYFKYFWIGIPSEYIIKNEGQVQYWHLLKFKEADNNVFPGIGPDPYNYVVEIKDFKNNGINYTFIMAKAGKSTFITNLTNKRDMVKGNEEGDLLNVEGIGIQCDNTNFEGINLL